MERFNLGVLFTQTTDWKKSSRPFFTRTINNAYSLFARKAEAKGFNAYFAEYTSYNNKKLRYAWRYEKGWKKTENIELDIVFNRFNKAVFKGNLKDKKAERIKYKIFNEIGTINHPLLEEFCWDKHKIYEMFPEYSPQTFLVNSYSGFKKVIPLIRGKRIVIKPRYGTLGKDVKIFRKKKMIKNIDKKIKKNTIVQRYINTKHGIKGLVDGVHDMRIIIINGKINHAHIRAPKKGLIANMSLGGEKIFIKNEEIPKQAVEIVKKVDSALRNFYPRVFSVDFLFDKNQKPYIVECNSSPTLHRYAYGKYKKPEYFDDLLDAIKRGVRLKVKNLVN